jgi:hypothetical protein
MSTAYAVTTPASKASVVAHDALVCTVCDHQLGGHDAISHRFCNATQAQALDRGCICRSKS